jgi:hypothetical protein
MVSPFSRLPSNALGLQAEKSRMVDTTGIEPVTPAISTPCCLNFDLVARR